MPIGNVPLASELPVSSEGRAMWTKPWGNFFTQLWETVFAWRKTYYGTITNDFGSINAQSQATQTVTITGARVGDMAFARATTAVNGIFIDASVTADDTVTLRAANYSSGSINPTEQVYRIIVFQQ